MKTIEEKLSKYLDSKSGDSLGSPINALSAGFRDGYNEALRWRDPEKELPENGVKVLVKVQQYIYGKAVNGLYKYAADELWESVKGYKRFQSYGNSVIGWRPIE